jgi:hypothetical protein
MTTPSPDQPDTGDLPDNTDSHRYRLRSWYSSRAQAGPGDLSDYNPGYRFWPRNGYLIATRSSAAPYSADEARRIYGGELMYAAVNRRDGPDGAAIPGQEWRRHRYHLWQRWKVPVICVATPFLAPLAAAALAGMVLAVLVWPPVLARGSTMSNRSARRAALTYASAPGVVFMLVFALWLILDLPPPGTVQWLVAAEVAATVTFPVLILWLPIAAMAVASGG